MKTTPSERSDEQSVSPEPDSLTTIPTKTSSDSFQALPEGAFVGDGAYYVASLRSEGPEYNVYGVEESCAVLPCPNLECGHLDNGANEESCAVCGTALSGVAPVHRRHKLHEYQNAAAVTMAAHVSKLDLNHPGLLPYSYFVEQPYDGQDRYYLLLPDPTPLLASQLKVPQKVARVLVWGAQLADALAHLHKQHVGWQEIGADHIAIRDRRAMWTDFNTTQTLSTDETQASQQRLQDVTGLVHLMFYLSTGKDTYAPDIDLPEMAARIFHRFLGEDEVADAATLADSLRQAVEAIRRPVTLRLRVGRYTDVGMVRDVNEDSLLTLELDRVHRSVSRPIGLYVVADGMGGHAAGDVASGLAINTIAEQMVTQLLVPQLTNDDNGSPFDPQEWLADAVQAGNRAVYAHRKSVGTDMGTTLVAALVIGDMAYIANVGDSRAYLINENGMHQITTDHSLVERLVMLGQIAPEDARTHPQRNVIYRTIGDKEEAEVDFFVQQLHPGDSLLLCSDGLNGKVEDADIYHIVKRCRSPQEACEQLVEAANDNGGDDNITVIIVQAKGQ